jgi:hypothetical protein
VVDDADAWADYVVADAEAELSRRPRRQRALGEARLADAFRSAAQIRDAGPNRRWRSLYYAEAPALAAAADLHRAHPNPGVRYEVVTVEAVDDCPDCGRPRAHADGGWRHSLLGGNPVECPEPPKPVVEHQPGEFEVDMSRGSFTCGWCDVSQSWADVALGYAHLTGFHSLGAHRETGELVVLAEIETLGGKITWLPHHCAKIPQDVCDGYAADVAEAVAR